MLALPPLVIARRPPCSVPEASRRYRDSSLPSIPLRIRTIGSLPLDPLVTPVPLPSPVSSRRAPVKHRRGPSLDVAGAVFLLSTPPWPPRRPPSSFPYALPTESLATARGPRACRHPVHPAPGPRPLIRLVASRVHPFPVDWVAAFWVPLCARSRGPPACLAWAVTHPAVGPSPSSAGPFRPAAPHVRLKSLKRA